MKLLLFVNLLIISTIASAQYLKPEVRKLMERTELNQSYKSLLEPSDDVRNNVVPGLIRLQPQNTRGLENFPNPYPAIKKSQLQNIISKDTIIYGNKYFFNFGSRNSIRYNMPVLVPDTKDIAPIPNFWKGDVAYKGSIPNPVLPFNPESFYYPGIKVRITTRENLTKPD